jgi:hypothetical protein
MPEVILCTYCGKSIDKNTDEFVKIRKETKTTPEELAHVSCEQKRRDDGGLGDVLNRIRDRLNIKW